MKRTAFLLSGLLIGILVLSGCHNTTKKEDNSITVRQPVDTIGFAQYDWQMDSIMARIEREQGKILNDKLSYSNLDSLGWKVAISPHDDYSYVGYLYPAVLKNIKAKTIIIFGVAHKAKRFNLEDQIKKILPKDIAILQFDFVDLREADESFDWSRSRIINLSTEGN